MADYSGAGAYSILAVFGFFDQSRWNPNIVPAPWAANPFFADRTVWAGVPVQPSAAGVPPAGYQPPEPPTEASGDDTPRV